MLPTDVSRCNGEPSPLRPGHPLMICRSCHRLERDAEAQFSWIVPPAFHDGRVWRCSARIADDTDAIRRGEVAHG